MAAIEHRNPDTLLDAYKHFDKCNWAIFCVNEPRDQYHDNDRDEAEQKLRNYLDGMYQMGLNQTYTFRCYNDNCGEITSKTKFPHSTTFNFSNSNLPRNADGQPVININPNPGNAVGALHQSNALSAKVQELEKALDQTKDLLFKQQLENIESKFQNQIAGLREQYQQPPEKNWWDRLESFVDKIIEKPEIVEKISGAIRGMTGGKRDYTINPVTQPISGTEQQEEEDTDTMSGTTVTVNTILSDEERKLSKDAQSDLLVQRLAEKSADELEDIQNDALDIIEARITGPVLARLLITVAELSDKDLKKLLNHLD